MRRFIRDRTHSDHSWGYRACDERRHVSSCLCSAPHQQLVRATIGALALGCPPLGNSRTRSYHAVSPPHGACVRYLTFAPVNDHVIPSDVTFTVGRCLRAACGDDVIPDVGNLVLMFNSYLYALMWLISIV